MNILLLVDDMLPGGVARHVSDLANGLVARGHFVSVSATTGPFADRLSSKVEFIPISLLREESYDKTPFGFVRAFLTLNKYVRRRRFDIIHTHKRYTDALGRLLARLQRVPHISTCHSTFTWGRLFTTFGDHTIAVSDAIRRMLISQFGKASNSVSLIVNEIQPLKQLSADRRRKLRNELGLANTQNILVSIGQFIPSKDRQTLLEALAILKREQKLTGVVILLVGFGPEYELLKEMVRNYSLSEHVNFLPDTTNVETILNLADFCVLSSVRDGGIPYTILEAASLGKAHIATNVGGIPEFIRDGETGLLADARDANGLAKLISFGLDNPLVMRTLGRNAKEQFYKRLASNNFIDRTVEVYKRAC